MNKCVCVKQVSLCLLERNLEYAIYCVCVSARERQYMCVSVPVRHTTSGGYNLASTSRDRFIRNLSMEQLKKRKNENKKTSERDGKQKREKERDIQRYIERKRKILRERERETHLKFDISNWFFTQRAFAARPLYTPHHRVANGVQMHLVHLYGG